MSRSRKSRAIPLPPLWAFRFAMGYLYLYETKIQVLEFYFKRQYLAP
jgi:hypothetical protein